MPYSANLPDGTALPGSRLPAYACGERGGADPKSGDGAERRKDRGGVKEEREVCGKIGARFLISLPYGFIPNPLTCRSFGVFPSVPYNSQCEKLNLNLLQQE